VTSKLAREEHARVTASGDVICDERDKTVTEHMACHDCNDCTLRVTPAGTIRCNCLLQTAYRSPKQMLSCRPPDVSGSYSSVTQPDHSPKRTTLGNGPVDL
jgi:hypothetical protein